MSPVQPGFCKGTLDASDTLPTGCGQSVVCFGWRFYCLNVCSIQMPHLPLMQSKQRFVFSQGRMSPMVTKNAVAFLTLCPRGESKALFALGEGFIVLFIVRYYRHISPSCKAKNALYSPKGECHRWWRKTHQRLALCPRGESKALFTLGEGFVFLIVAR